MKDKLGRFTRKPLGRIFEIKTRTSEGCKRAAYIFEALVVKHPPKWKRASAKKNRHTKNRGCILLKSEVLLSKNTDWRRTKLQ